MGQDELGDEILAVAKGKMVYTEFVTRARPGLPTGTVRVSLDANSNASYELAQPVAWDEIRLPEAALEAVSKSRALIFGTLAARSPYNLDGLKRLLAAGGPLKLFDMNLRPPFANPTLVMDLAKRADVIKLNDEELGRMAAWLRTGQMTGGPVETIEAVAEACAALAGAAGAARLCVTRGAKGALFWDRGKVTSAVAPAVAVKDTVGAGDAFMAGLAVGLVRQSGPREMLERACRLGAYVASQHGAIPPIPPGIIREFKDA